MTSKRTSLLAIVADPPASGTALVVDAVAAAARRRDRADGSALAAAQRLLDAGRADDARAALAPLAADPTTAVRAHACLLYAGLLLMAGRADEALRALAAVPRTAPFAVDEGYRRMIEACALRQARRYPEALAAARGAVELGATSGRLLVLADAQKHAGELHAAVRTLAALLDDEPGNLTALAQLAGYRNLLGDRDEAARLHARFRALDDGSADARRNDAFYHATRGDLAPALAALEIALRAEPEATRSYIADEVELERYRTDERLRALTAR